MLINGDFELGTWTRETHSGKEYGEVFVPTGWTAFWKEGLPVPHDPTNPNGYGRPEMAVIRKVAPFLDPPRIHAGEWAVKWFTFYRIHDAGLYQTVTVTPGSQLKLTAWAHAWSSNGDDPRVSDKDGDGAGNATFRVGIDPEGGTDPWGPRVIWGKPAHIYNVYAEVPALEVVAPGSQITVFVRSEILWPFKHCDVYLDDVLLTEIGVTPPPGPPEEFVAVVELLPMNATLAESVQVTERTYIDRRTVAHSVADAIRVVDQGQPGSRVDVWNPERWLQDITAYLLAAGIREVRQFHLTTATPPPGYMPVNRTPRGTKLSFQGAYPVDFFNRLAAAGVTLPTFKFVQSIGDIAKTSETHIMARLIDDPRSHVPLEGFDYNSDPERQAEERVAALWPYFEPYAATRLTSIELINEQGMPRNDKEAPVKLARFFMRAMDLLEPRGVVVAWPSASVGTPEPSQWDAMIPTGIFERSAEKGHVISVHEYGPTVDGPSATICRYRDLYNRILIPRGLDIACFITEFNVSSDLLNGDVWAHWEAYDRLVRQDPYVQGVHIFIVGGGQGWDAYHNATVRKFPRFLEYAIAEKEKANG